MAHQRQLIREAVKAQLADKTAAGARVFETRTAPLRQVELPAISVYTLSETVDPESRRTAPRELTRTARLVVLGVVAMSADVDDELDDLAVQIERALDADPNFGGTAFDSILSSVELGIDDQDGRRVVGALEMTYSVTYKTDAPAAADTALTDLRTVEITADPNGSTAAGNQSKDRVTFPAP